MNIAIAVCHDEQSYRGDCFFYEGSGNALQYCVCNQGEGMWGPFFVHSEPGNIVYFWRAVGGIKMLLCLYFYSLWWEYWWSLILWSFSWFQNLEKLNRVDNTPYCIAMVFIIYFFEIFMLKTWMWKCVLTGHRRCDYPSSTCGGCLYHRTDCIRKRMSRLRGGKWYHFKICYQNIFAWTVVLL